MFRMTTKPGLHLDFFRGGELPEAPWLYELKLGPLMWRWHSFEEPGISTYLARAVLLDLQVGFWLAVIVVLFLASFWLAEWDPVVFVWMAAAALVTLVTWLGVLSGKQRKEKLTDGR